MTTAKKPRATILTSSIAEFEWHRQSWNLANLCRNGITLPTWYAAQFNNTPWKAFHLPTLIQQHYHKKAPSPAHLAAFLERSAHLRPIGFDEVLTTCRTITHPITIQQP